MTNAKTVVTPTSTTVHGRALPMVCATVWLGNEYDVPNRSVAMLFQVITVLDEQAGVRRAELGLDGCLLGVGDRHAGRRELAERRVDR